MRSRRRCRLVPWLALVALLLTACRSPGRGLTPGTPPGDQVVVASFNFAESRLLAEIYARALEEAGIPVGRELDLGPRELVQPALLAGLVDVVPEYLGTALASLGGPDAAGGNDVATRRVALQQSLRAWDVDVRQPAPAQNQNGLAVTRATAERFGLQRTSDLVHVAPPLTLGGPPECPRRAYCLPGFERVYGVHFGRFLAFESEQQRVTALEQQVVDVAVMFSTDAALATGDLVFLEDDRSLQPPENVVPVVSARALARYGPRLGSTLDAVSARLTSNSLVFLNWRVAVAGKDPADEARGWLRREGLIPRAA